MSYYDGTAQGQPPQQSQPWSQPSHAQQQHSRQQSQPQSQQQAWGQQSPSIDPGSAQGPPGSSPNDQSIPEDEAGAFDSQFEEINRAVDNLVKSGKQFGFSAPGGPRRDVHGMQMGFQGQFPPLDPMAPGQFRRPMYPEYGNKWNQPSASNYPGFIAGQRYGRQEPDYLVQHKRRAAARERELRNQHQEQQYNRNVTDRSMSPGSMSGSGMSQDEHRELLAKQHRALYPSSASGLYIGPESSQSRPMSNDSRGAGTGASPLSYDSYGSVQSSSQQDGGKPQSAEPQSSSRDRDAGKSATPSSGKPPTGAGGAYGLFDSSQQSGVDGTSADRTAQSESPSRGGSTNTPTAPSGPGTIGSRPGASNQTAGGSGKRNTPPFGETGSSSSQQQQQGQQSQQQQQQQREGAGNGSGNSSGEGKSVGLGGWGGNGAHGGHSHGPWGGKGSLGQTTVW